MLGGVKEVNYFIAFIAFEITLMQRPMIQASYIMFIPVISLLLTLLLSCASNWSNNYDITLIA